MVSNHIPSYVEAALDGSPHEALSLLADAEVNGRLSVADRLNHRVLRADHSHSRTDGQTEVSRPIRVAIVSLLFNWPSTGGGIVHTAELAQFLTRAGYDVCHYYAKYRPWNMGEVTQQLPYHSCELEFGESTWNRESIIATYRQAMHEFAPDVVIVTDSWSTKPLLATAVSEYPYFLRLAALECLCPLNNVRLIPGPGGQPVQCHRTQLANRQDCLRCIETHQNASGPLHVAERQLACWAEQTYESELRTAFENAEGILAVNPLIGALCEPYARAVHVIQSGFDSDRFEDLQHRSFGEKPFRLLFAGLTEEYMKGFQVLFEACAQLWSLRQDFELHVTADQSPYEAPFLRYRGWQSQDQLPALMADCHAVVVPTIAQEALGRTAVEAMGAARPVIASQIGGLSWAVVDEFTGLHCEPANPASLMRCCQQLMNDSRLAARLGAQGRRRFLAKHTWSRVTEDLYRPLLAGFVRQ